MPIAKYRTVDPVLGDCARMTRLAGDGYPFLTREIYEALRFEPRFDDLPTEEAYVRDHQPGARHIERNSHLRVNSAEL